MVIEKLNKIYKNDLTTKLNANDFQENVDKIDEIIENVNNIQNITCKVIKESQCNADELTKYGNAIIETENVSYNFPETGSSQHYHLLQFVYDSNYAVQLAIHVWRIPMRIYIRRKVNGTWSSWTSLTPT